ncbi:FAD-dependent oxidoreductase [Thermomonospora amylolytica]|uniref:FAD-dependent oxidoreductase n=1 Tax=Thermomonospora amylolytica TaxID=1411117 RepID=UPI000E6D458D|nr:2-polyprenyl-6-methoxyphenol hydroxylase-like oxidoreductase [Thermomonospora amylolytica]
MTGAGDHAVVLGAGVAGLLAARVLADHFEHVTIVERDRLPARIAPRPGVLQGPQPHALLPRGARAMEELLPGLLADLEAGGAPVVRDYRSAFHFAPGGRPLCRDMRPGGPFYHSSRPYLEHHVRARVLAWPGVGIVERCEALGPVADDGRVAGIRIRHGADGAEQIMPSALVVDATGRDANTPGWLTALGYDRPREERIPVDVRYVSQSLRMRRGCAPPQQAVGVGATPGRPTGMSLITQEDGTWQFTVSGYGRHRPPGDLAGMLAFVAEFAPPGVLSALRAAEPAGAITAFHFPASRRHRYERLTRFPEGLLAIGDALCSPNPIYGHGLTLAALEAASLRDCLRHGARGLARRFFRAAAGPADAAWRMAAGADLSLPEVAGPRPFSVRILNRYATRLAIRAEHDPVLATRLIRVAFMLDPPTHLLLPSTVRRALSRPRS